MSRSEAETNCYPPGAMFGFQRAPSSSENIFLATRKQFEGLTKQSIQKHPKAICEKKLWLITNNFCWVDEDSTTVSEYRTTRRTAAASVIRNARRRIESSPTIKTHAYPNISQSFRVPVHLKAARGRTNPTDVRPKNFFPEKVNSEE